MKLLSTLLFITISLSAWGQEKPKFQKADEAKLNYCNCDSIYKNWPPKSAKKNDGPEFDGNGWHMLYNFKNEVGQCGYFKNFNFIYGHQFRYDPNGKIIAINKFFNGKKIGTCELKK